MTSTGWKIDLKNWKWMLKSLKIDSKKIWQVTFTVMQGFILACWSMVTSSHSDVFWFWRMLQMYWSTSRPSRFAFLLEKIVQLSDHTIFLSSVNLKQQHNNYNSKVTTITTAAAKWRTVFLMFCKIANNYFNHKD